MNASKSSAFNLNAGKSDSAKSEEQQGVETGNPRDTDEQDAGPDDATDRDPVTFYSLRRDGNKERDEQREKVTAARDSKDPGRLMIIFRNMGLKSKPKQKQKAAESDDEYEPEKETSDEGLQAGGGKD